MSTFASRPAELGPSTFERAWAQRETVARTPLEPGLFLALAPMDGVTDHVHRDLLSSMFGGRSGLSICVCEFVRVTNQVVPDHVFLRHCPELARGGVTRAGVPVFVQLLGGRPEAMAAAALRAAELGAPGIDLNFGCPAKRVNGHDGGAALLKAPERVARVTEAVRARVPAEIPVTVKVRVGWEDAMPMVDIARAAEAGGAAWLTVHARTRAQLYKPPVDWPALGRAREAISIPVVANGDLFEVEDLAACAAQSGCSAFMIGRGAMGHPEIFARARSQAKALAPSERIELLLDYAARLLAAGASERAALGRLKQWLRLGAPLRTDLALHFDAVKRMSTLEEAAQRLRSCAAAAASAA